MKRKFNWIDYCIILFIIAVIAVLGLKIKNIRSVDLTGNNETVKTKKDVILVIEDVRQYSIDALQLGDNVYSDDTNYYFGKIKNIEVEDSYLPLIKNDGEGVLVRSPEKYNIILTVECNVLDRPNGVFAEGITEIKVNSTGKYKTIGLLFSAITKGIQE
jgi:hypothetical protein